MRTRFAPSPTGFLHIGGLRTAVFNYLHAKAFGGAFVVRVEDTDLERSTEASTQQILETLDWLGLTSDQPVVMQSTRMTRHQEVAQTLLDRGLAYIDASSMEETEALRALRRKGKNVVNPWRDHGPHDRPGVLRLKAPLTGKTQYRDLVRGEVGVSNSTLDDLALLRSDGTPTYMLAVVVDDHDMEITHVIRGDDHATNTFRQLLIYDALGWDRPQFAHIPLIYGPDGKKMSKRDGAADALEWRQKGILPKALIAYLVQLGWKDSDDYTSFDVSDVGVAPARFDAKKLLHINAKMLRAQDQDTVRAMILQQIEVDPARLQILLPDLVERSSTVQDLLQGARVLQPLTGYTDPALERLRRRDPDRWARLHAALKTVDFEKAALKAWLHDFVQAEGVKMVEVAQDLRAALTGSLQSPPLDSVLCALGREESLMRLERAP